VDIPTRDPAGREISKTRLCIIVSVAALNRARSTVVMMPLSNDNKVYPPITISIASACPNSVAVCDQLLAVNKQRLKQQKGQINPAEMTVLDDSLRMLLGLLAAPRPQTRLQIARVSHPEDLAPAVVFA
jgi:mRNA interferase MazF